MKKTIPSNYDTAAWAEYYQAHPMAGRAVGAAAAEGGEDEGEGGEGEQPATDPALEDLRQRLEAQQQELERWQAKAREADKHKKEQEKQARAKTEEAARAAGDFKALEESYQAKFQTEISARDEQLAQYQAMIERAASGQSAMDMANRLAQDSTYVPGLLPHIQARLKTEIIDGNPVVKVVDANGRPSAMSLADLEKEIRTLPYLKPMISAGRGSGAGHNGAGATGGATTITRAEFDKLSPADKVDAAKKMREGKLSLTQG